MTDFNPYLIFVAAIPLVIWFIARKTIFKDAEDPEQDEYFEETLE